MKKPLKVPGAFDADARIARQNLKTTLLEAKPAKVPSLINRIRAAPTREAIDKLMAEGEGYRYAADDTRSRWRIAAQWRRCQLVVAV